MTTLVGMCATKAHLVFYSWNRPAVAQRICALQFGELLLLMGRQLSLNQFYSPHIRLFHVPLICSFFQSDSLLVRLLIPFLEIFSLSYPLNLSLWQAKPKKVKNIVRHSFFFKWLAYFNFDQKLESPALKAVAQCAWRSSSNSSSLGRS